MRKVIAFVMLRNYWVWCGLVVVIYFIAFPATFIFRLFEAVRNAFDDTADGIHLNLKRKHFERVKREFLTKLEREGK